MCCSTKKQEIYNYFDEKYGVHRNDTLKGVVARNLSNGSGCLVDIGIEIQVYMQTTFPIGTEVLLSITDTFIGRFGDSIHARLDSVLNFVYAA